MAKTLGNFDKMRELKNIRARAVAQTEPRVRKHGGKLSRATCRAAGSTVPRVPGVSDGGWPYRPAICVPAPSSVAGGKQGITSRQWQGSRALVLGDGVTDEKRLLVYQDFTGSDLTDVKQIMRLADKILARQIFYD